MTTILIFPSDPNARAYARAALADSLTRGETPLAPGLQFEGLDGEHAEAAARVTGWLLQWADRLAVYEDRGLDEDMQADLDTAALYGLEIEHRRLGVEA